MLTYSQLAKLERSARARHVLHAYVDPTELDAVARRAWRKTLANAVVAQRKALSGAPHAERNEFDKAAELLEKLTGELRDDVDGAAGWAAFITADGLLHAGPTYRAPPTSLTWRTGIAAAPYMRLFQGPADVIVALVDARSTDLYRVSGRGVERVGHVNAHAHVGRAAHMGDSAREGFHTGTRGTALADAAHRALEVGRERMLHDVANELEGLARPNGWIVIAGTRSNAHDAIKHLGKAAQKRALYVPGPGMDASEAEIATAAVEGRHQLETEHEKARVTEIVDRAVGRGRAVVGLEATVGALATGAAREVLATPRFLDERPEDAEAVALDVLTHGSRLVEVRGEAGERLDAEAGGIAAALRFPSRAGRVAAGLASAHA